MHPVTTFRVTLYVKFEPPPLLSTGVFRVDRLNSLNLIFFLGLFLNCAAEDFLSEEFLVRNIVDDRVAAVKP